MITVAVAASAVNVSADGFRLPDQDAFATARGEAFVATADNASAIYYNPAGISQLQGGNFRGGIYGIYLPVTYKSPSGRSFDNEKDLQAVPQLFLTFVPAHPQMELRIRRRLHGLEHHGHGDDPASDRLCSIAAKRHSCDARVAASVVLQIRRHSLLR